MQPTVVECKAETVDIKEHFLYDEYVKSDNGERFF